MIALVRPPSDRIRDALTRAPGPRPDPDRAREQHNAYVAALRQAGCTIVSLPPEPDLADACFVEDTVVVARGRALLTRPGAPSRRPEVASVAAALPSHLEVHHTTGEATLDGGDVLVVGEHLFVGRSARTNAAGVRALRACFEPAGLTIVPVSVTGALHLKCHASRIACDTVVLAEGFVPPEVFAPYKTLVLPAHEAYAANLVHIGHQVIIAEGYPETRDRLRRAGWDPMSVSVGEIAAADGSLTCLSVLVRP